jgi:hypothetical protein
MHVKKTLILEILCILCNLNSLSIGQTFLFYTHLHSFWTLELSSEVCKGSSIYFMKSTGTDYSSCYADVKTELNKLFEKY